MQDGFFVTTTRLNPQTGQYEAVRNDGNGGYRALNDAERSYLDQMAQQRASYAQQDAYNAQQPRPELPGFAGVQGGGNQPNPYTAPNMSVPPGGTINNRATATQVQQQQNPSFVVGPAPAPPNPYMPQGSMSQLQSIGQQQWQNTRDKSHAQWAGQPGMAGSDMGMSTNPRTGPNFTQNPYLPAMADDITRRASTQFMQQINPAINRAAVANGGYGGSRQGIAQGLAMSQGMDNIAGQLAGLYGNQFNADRNYGLQSDALDLNIYNANQGWMQQGQQQQLNTLDRLLGWNQQYGIGNSTNIQNTPLNYWQQFSQGAQGLGGMGGTGTNYLQGNPWLGALGGYQLGKSLWGG